MGNCLGLCVTKFLGLSEELDLDCDYQLSLLGDWLRPRGYSFVRISASRLTEVMMPDDSDYILIVDIINEGLHAVLCKGRDIVYDPRGKGKYVYKLEHVVFLCKRGGACEIA